MLNWLFENQTCKPSVHDPCSSYYLSVVTGQCGWVGGWRLTSGDLRTINWGRRSVGRRSTGALLFGFEADLYPSFVMLICFQLGILWLKVSHICLNDAFTPAYLLSFLSLPFPLFSLQGSTRGLVLDNRTRIVRFYTCLWIFQMRVIVVVVHIRTSLRVHFVVVVIVAG